MVSAAAQSSQNGVPDQSSLHSRALSLALALALAQASLSLPFLNLFQTHPYVTISSFLSPRSLGPQELWQEVVTDRPPLP